MKNTVKFIAIALAFILALATLGCSAKTNDNEIKIGASVTPHAEILQQAKAILEKEGITLTIVEYDDYVQPNIAVDDGSLDANYFQHLPYLNSFNSERGTSIISIGAVHYEPFGIYAGKTASLDQVKEGATVGVPNDGSNETRALLLLQQEGLIVLKDGIDAASNATVLDIVENPYNLQIIEMAAAQVSKSLADMDFGVINGNYALQAGLVAGRDALALEDASGSGAVTYGNVLCTKAGRENEEKLLRLYQVLCSKEISDFIDATYDGAVVALNK